MGWSNHVLSFPFTKIAANGQGDLQLALRSGATSQISLWENGVVNKWARRKRFNLNAIYTDRYGDTNSQRLAGLKTALFGFGSSGIPVYTSAAELTAALRSGITAGSHWNLPAATPPYRALDFEGYADDNIVSLDWGTLGVNSPTWLKFPFEGSLDTSDDPVTPYSIAAALLEWTESNGLLYPGDFAGTTIPLSEWHFGMLVTPATVPASGNTDLWLLTCGDKIKEGNNSLTNITFTQGESDTPLGNPGQYLIFPIICSIEHNNSGNPVFQNYKNTWSGEGGGPGKLVLLDGYRLPIQLTGSSNPLEFTFSMSSTTQVNISIKNTARLPIRFYGSSMFGYLMSSYVAGRTLSEDVDDAAVDWVDNGTEYTTSVKDSSNRIIGRYIDCMAAFRDANPNSDKSIIPAGATVSFSVSSGASTDGLGYPYGSGAEMYFCYDYGVQGHNNHRDYELLD